MGFVEGFKGGYSSATGGTGLVQQPDGTWVDPRTGQVYAQNQIVTAQGQGRPILNPQAAVGTSGPTSAQSTGVPTSQPAAGQPAASQSGGLADQMGVPSADLGSILGNNGKKARGESTGGAVGTGVGAATGIPGGAQVGGAVGEAVGGAIAGDDEEPEMTEQEKYYRELRKQKEMKRKSVDPTGISSEAYTLAHMGPLSRIPGVANFMIKQAGGKQLSKKEQMLNLVRPPLPAYNLATAHKMQAAGAEMAKAKGRLAALGLGMGALTALSSLSSVSKA